MFRYKKGADNIKDDQKTLEKLFDYFDNPALYRKISNVERFKLLSEQAEKEGVTLSDLLKMFKSE